MPLSTISNGDSSATARAAINAAIDLINSTPESIIKQRVRAEYTTTPTGTNFVDLRYSTTAPAMTALDEFMSITITPTVSTNRLRVKVVGYFSNSAATQCITLIARSGDANARSYQCTLPATLRSDYATRIEHEFDEEAGTTSAITYKLRAGGNVSGTHKLNMATAGSYPWGQVSFIEVEEYTI